METLGLFWAVGGGGGGGEGARARGRVARTVPALWQWRGGALLVDDGAYYVRMQAYMPMHILVCNTDKYIYIYIYIYINNII